MTQLRRGVVGVIAAFVVVSLSFSAQAAEKKKVMGTNKLGQPFPAPSCLREMIQNMNWP